MYIHIYIYIYALLGGRSVVRDPAALPVVEDDPGSSDAYTRRYACILYVYDMCVYIYIYIYIHIYIYIY